MAEMTRREEQPAPVPQVRLSKKITNERRLFCKPLGRAK